MLDVEHQLVSEARKRLHAYLLLSKWDRTQTEQKIRQYAIEQVAMLTEDMTIRKIVTAAIQNESLDDAFPSVN